MNIKAIKVWMNKLRPAHGLCNSLLFFIFFTLICYRVQSQDTLNSLIVEQKTLQLYRDKNWTELINFGNTALKKGYDYFYIQMRMGIAYYEKKNYCNAESHFRKALQFSTGDELALEYLYYCYIFTGRNEDARMLSKTFGENLATKTGTDKLPEVSLFMFETGTKMANANSFSQDVSGAYAKGNTTTYFPTKSSSSISPATYFQAGLNHYKKNKISVFHALTYFTQSTASDSTIESQQKLSWHIPPPKNADTTITSVSTINSKHNYVLTQLQYYLKLGIPFKNGWMFSPSIDLIHTSLSDNSSISFTHPTPKPPPPPILVTPKPNDPPTAYPAYVLNSNYFAGSFVLQKIYKKFTFGVGTTFSNMLQEEVDRSTNKIKTSTPAQLINSGSVYFSPLGNNKFILGTVAYVHTVSAYKTTYVSSSSFVFVQPAKFFSFKVSYFYNVGRNIIEDNGYFVNNSPDLTLSRWSVLANFHISNSVTLYGTYLIESKLGVINELKYNYNIIAAGIRFIPTKK
jgi:tetratricopeptide (TPR) repeat protein